MKIIITNLIEMSLTASVVILAVMLVRLLLRGCPKIYSYVLWSIVAFRLCIPISFESNFSIFNLFHKTEIESVTNGTQVTSPVTRAMSDPYSVLGCIWLCGISILVIYSIFTYYRLQHKLRVSFPMYENVYGVDELSSPFVIGFRSPKIYIPLGLDPDTENYILMHERTHIRRGDHFVKLFAFALLCIHWFNPLCWAAFILMSRDMEMSCDEKVLNSGDISCGYSTALLSFAQNKRFPSPGPLCFGEVSVKRRIKNILHWKKPALWITVVSVILCVTVFAACACDPVEQEKPVQSEVTEEKTEKITKDTTTVDTTTADTTTADTTTADKTTADTTTVDTTTADTTTADTTTADTTTVDTTAADTTVTVTTSVQTVTTKNDQYYYYVETDAEETTGSLEPSDEIVEKMNKSLEEQIQRQMESMAEDMSRWHEEHTTVTEKRTSENNFSKPIRIFP